MVVAFMPQPGAVIAMCRKTLAAQVAAAQQALSDKKFA
jgi:hypothetical protein